MIKNLKKKNFNYCKYPKEQQLYFVHIILKIEKKTAKEVLKFCKIKGLKLLISSDVKMAREINADGIHLPEHMIYDQSKINWKNFKTWKSKFKWIVTAAAHDKKALYKAFINNVDAALLSPIFATKSHISKKKLGVTKLVKWVHEMKIPVYALGGINLSTIQYLKKTGVIGFAFQRGYE